MSLSSLLNNHINLFLSDNSGKNLLFILEKKVFLAKEYLLHLINKCSSSSTASQLHCLHILFSTAVFGIVYLPLSILSDMKHIGFKHQRESKQNSDKSKY